MVNNIWDNVVYHGLQVLRVIVNKYETVIRLHYIV